MEKVKNAALRLFVKLLIAAVSIFVVTFVVYFFNLDMKLTSVMEGFMLKHYDKIDRDQHL